MTVLVRLFPDATLLRLDACAVDDTTAQIPLRVRSTQTTVPCPLCTPLARRIHSHYERTLADLPWAPYRVRLQLRVRKWLCRNPQCRRRRFIEWLPTVAVPWARRTLRLAQRLVALGVALGGHRRGAPQPSGGPGGAPEHAAPPAPQAARPDSRPPTVLGVDDFALRKRPTYGTVCIDLERHQPVALLPERTTDTCAHGLREHPGVAVIARDRSQAYTGGAQHGAPAAAQVADRLPLLQHLQERLTRCVCHMTRPWMPSMPWGASRPSRYPMAVAVPVPPPAETPTPAQQLAVRRQARRQTLHVQVWT